MSNREDFQLTTKDYTILEVMRERAHEHGATMAAILQRKISRALVMFRDDIPPNVVTLSSRVTYRVDDEPAVTRIVAYQELRGLVGSLIPISNPRGLALLGLAEGQSMTITGYDGRPETVTVEEVVYQPEAARREKLAGTARLQPRRDAPILRLVPTFSSNMPARTFLAVADTGSDDPGPSAA
jgi:regulator of nucleoside diphosphate kinase